jgi:hypothetical protein
MKPKANEKMKTARKFLAYYSTTTAPGTTSAHTVAFRRSCDVFNFIQAVT